MVKVEWARHEKLTVPLKQQRKSGARARSCLLIHYVLYLISCCWQFICNCFDDCVYILSKFRIRNIELLPELFM